MITLICGLASIVPWVIVMTLPLTLAFGLAAIVSGLRRPGRPGVQAAVMGIGIGLGALVLHVSIAGLAALVGWLLG